MSQRVSLDWVGQLLNRKEEMDEAAGERSVAVGHAMHLRTSQFFSHLRSLLGCNSLYTLDDDKLFEENAVKKL